MTLFILIFVILPIAAGGLLLFRRRSDKMAEQMDLRCSLLISGSNLFLMTALGLMDMANAKWRPFIGHPLFWLLLVFYIAVAAADCLLLFRRESP